MSNANVLELREKVTRWLTETGTTPTIDKDGDLVVRSGSSRVFLRVGAMGDDHTLLNIWSPVLTGVPPSDELFEHLAVEVGGYPFGHVGAFEHGDGLAITFSHVLLGDYLDPAEFHNATAAVAVIADDIDTKLQARFGGNKSFEDAPADAT